MLTTFVAAIAVAAFAASVAFVLRRLTGVFPRWLIPASAGAAMLGFTIWNDYAWFARQAAGLPPETRVIDSFASRSAVQPWTWLAPAVTRYRALDLRSVARHAERPEIAFALIYLVQRFQPTFTTGQLLDCASGRRADAVAVGPDGLPPESAWERLPPDDALLRAVCDARPPA